MSALARQLQSRNHDVVMLSLSLIEQLARAANLPFIPFGEKEFPDQATAEIVGTLSRRAHWRITVDHLGLACRQMPTEVPVIGKASEISGPLIRILGFPLQDASYVYIRAASNYLINSLRFRCSANNTPGTSFRSPPSEAGE